MTTKKMTDLEKLEADAKCAVAEANVAVSTKKENNYFEELINIDVSNQIVEKLGLGGKTLSYLSWAWAWTKIKTIYPKARYKIYEREDGKIYWTDGKTAWVKTSVTVNEIEHIDYLAIMNPKYRSILLEEINSTDVIKTIQRSITKAIARHGLGLSLYVGEDLQEEKLTEQDIIKQKLLAASDEEMKQVFQDQNKKQFNDLKDKLESAASLEEIELIKTNNKKDINRLKKYAIDDFDALIDIGIRCKEDLMQPLTDKEKEEILNNKLENTPFLKSNVSI